MGPVGIPDSGAAAIGSMAGGGSVDGGSVAGGGVPEASVPSVTGSGTGSVTPGAGTECFAFQASKRASAAALTSTVSEEGGGAGVVGLTADPSPALRTALRSWTYWLTSGPMPLDPAASVFMATSLERGLSMFQSPPHPKNLRPDTPPSPWAADEPNASSISVIRAARRGAMGLHFSR